jgi:hypothetical protein
MLYNVYDVYVSRISFFAIHHKSRLSFASQIRFIHDRTNGGSTHRERMMVDIIVPNENALIPYFFDPEISIILIF